MLKRLQEILGERVDIFVGKQKTKEEKVLRKQDGLSERKAKIVKTNAVGKVVYSEKKDGLDHLYYNVHLKHLIKQCGNFYVEEEVEKRVASFKNKKLKKDFEVPIEIQKMHTEELSFQEDEMDERVRYTYDRLQVVQYAERWWNEYNPAYPKFDVDCTNYVSQCLHAGGAPMRGHPNRNKGWWQRNKNWSFSWSVAHALKQYLQNSSAGLRAEEVYDPLELQLGDVICYDFQGDGRFDHNTVVTGKDATGMPLVNAHTYNSRMRYWAYEDSSAYTPNIQYKMFHILDNGS